MLVFRALTYVLPVPLGLLTWLFWRARPLAGAAPPGARPAPTLVPEDVTAQP